MNDDDVLYLERLRAIERINEENAADFPPRSLRGYTKPETRGPHSVPAVWYEKMAGVTWAAAVESEQKSDGVLYKRETQRWRGWTGANARRVQQRQQSFYQTQVRDHLLDRSTARLCASSFVRSSLACGRKG